MVEVGDRVLTPENRTGTVVRVVGSRHPKVEVAYDEQFRGTKVFRARSLTVMSMRQRYRAGDDVPQSEP